jgi:hypothetical protein
MRLFILKVASSLIISGTRKLAMLYELYYKFTLQTFNNRLERFPDSRSKILSSNRSSLS